MLKGQTRVRFDYGSVGGSGTEARLVAVQSDPYAPPSTLSLRLPLRPRFDASSGMPIGLFGKANEADNDEAAATLPTEHAVPVSDFLARRAAASVRELPNRTLSLPGISPTYLTRARAIVSADRVDFLFSAHLPAHGRRIDGQGLRSLFCTSIPKLIASLRAWTDADETALRTHVECYLDAQALQAELRARNAVAFIRDGAILPRASSASTAPMREAVPWKSPKALRATLSLPHSSPTGTLIPRGVTLIVGGGFHGKSTLLDALTDCVYPHIPGDGRDGCATVNDAVSIRAEDGRPVTRVDISPFIKDLPRGAGRSSDFSTRDASGSTSQAANILEALEVGTSCLLIDEDTSATNLLTRDARMAQLVEHEPITPLLHKVRPLAKEEGVSVILVVGGSGDFFEEADTVIKMDSYEPSEVTEAARSIAREMSTGAVRAGSAEPFGRVTERTFTPSRCLASLASAKVKSSTDIRGSMVAYLAGRGQGGPTVDLDLSHLAQIVEGGQNRAIADALTVLPRGPSKTTTLAEAVHSLVSRLEKEGPSAVLRDATVDYSVPRAAELFAALARLPVLQVDEIQDKGTAAARASENAEADDKRMDDKDDEHVEEI